MLRRRGRPGLSRAGRALLALAALAFFAAPAARGFAATTKSILLLPIASGTPGQEWAARALGAVVEEQLGALAGARLVGGPAREEALRELASREALESERFQEICRRAGADVAVFGGSTLGEGRLALEVRIFDAASAREARAFRGEETAARAFPLAAAAVRHLAEQTGIALTAADEARLARVPTGSLEAYAAYRAALREETAASRIAQLRAVLELDPRFADAARRLGVELFRQGAATEAVAALEQAVALDPGDAESRNNLGVVLASQGRAEQAQRELDRAVELDPAYAEARLNLARVLEERGNLAEAERQYATLLDADAGNDKARFGRAVLYDRTSRPELALREFRQLSARRPDLAEAEFLRAGQEARKSREYARAAKYFQRAAEINPQRADVWAELGTNSYLAGEYARGTEFFRKALALEPTRGEYHYYLGLALDHDRHPQEALGAFRRSVELGGPPEARVGLARAALDAGDPGLAVEELNRLLAASPGNAEGKTLLAQATAELEARRRLVEEQSRFANQRLARLEQIVADVNRANRGLEARAAESAQERRLVEEELGRLRAEAERLRAALAEREAALAESRRMARDLALELGRAALRARAWEQARAAFERVVAIDPGATEAWTGLGDALTRLGQHERARQMYDRAKGRE
ncbi:MAG TPA: tetratricopeptide repeat protein [Candidatus Methanoperedens sp.]|nr:tetratricopeptide repeat protein [Candidatus Methanoperedens sp.]